ncbi:hypothetical protein [Mesorhizobium amorphae]
MPDFDLKPGVGAGQMTFGMSPQDIRKVMDGEPVVFRRTPSDDFPCDFFSEAGVFCYYDKSGRLNAIEFAQPARPVYGGFAFVGMEFEPAKAALASLGKIEEEPDSAISLGLGVSIYSSLAKDDVAAPVETVLIFQEGYYGRAVGDQSEKTGSEK